MSYHKLHADRGTIIWDMDDTLCHFMDPTLKELGVRMGIKLTQKQLVNSQWLNDFLTKEQLDEFLPHVFNPAFYATLKPTAILDSRHSREFTYLHDKFDFGVVTARRYALNRLALRVTTDWLHANGAHDLMDSITICHPDQSKVDAAPANTKVVVDDSATVALHGASKGWKVFLVDRPWNRHLDTKLLDNVIRVTHENTIEIMANELLH